MSGESEEFRRLMNLMDSLDVDPAERLDEKLSTKLKATFAAGGARQEAKGALEREEFTKTLMNQYRFWIGKTGSKPTFDSLRDFFVNDVGLDSYEYIDMYKSWRGKDAAKQDPGEEVPAENEPENKDSAEEVPAEEPEAKPTTEPEAAPEAKPAAEPEYQIPPLGYHVPKPSVAAEPEIPPIPAPSSPPKAKAPEPVKPSASEVETAALNSYKNQISGYEKQIAELSATPELKAENKAQIGRLKQKRANAIERMEDRAANPPKMENVTLFGMPLMEAGMVVPPTTMKQFFAFAGSYMKKNGLDTASLDREYSNQPQQNYSGNQASGRSNYHYELDNAGQRRRVYNQDGGAGGNFMGVNSKEFRKWLNLGGVTDSMDYLEDSVENSRNINSIKDGKVLKGLARVGYAFFKGRLGN